MIDNYDFYTQAWSENDIEIRIDDKTIWLTKEGLIELINLLVQQLGHT